MTKIVALAAIICLCSSGSVWCADLPAEQQNKVIKSVDSYAMRMSEVALKIGRCPSLATKRLKHRRCFKTSARRQALGLKRGSLIFQRLLLHVREQTKDR